MGRKTGTENFLCGELIGLKAMIVDSTDAGRIGLSGKIVDETMQTFVLETKSGKKTVPKKEVTIKFFLPGKKTVMVEGKKIVFRPEDRIKALIGKKIDGEQKGSG